MAKLTHNPIFTDSPETKQPVLDFPKFGSAITHIILNSTPQFTLGIFGEWGSGKTTMMKLIQQEIKSQTSNQIQTLWFNAWRYERETAHATYPLLISILGTLSTNPHIQKILDNSGFEIILIIF